MKKITKKAKKTTKTVKKTVNPALYPNWSLLAVVIIIAVAIIVFSNL